MFCDEVVHPFADDAMEVMLDSCKGTGRNLVTDHGREWFEEVSVAAAFGNVDCPFTFGGPHRSPGAQVDQPQDDVGWGAVPCGLMEWGIAADAADPGAVDPVSVPLQDVEDGRPVAILCRVGESITALEHPAIVARSQGATVPDGRIV